MSPLSPVPSSDARTELETVVNWPLLLGAVGLASVLLAVPVVLAWLTTSRGATVKDTVAVLPASTLHQPAIDPPTARPFRPAIPSDSAPRETPLQIYVPGKQPPIPPDRPPVRPVMPKPVQPPPALDPILQFPEVKRPLFRRLDERTEATLFQQLLEQAREVDLESVKGTRDKLLAEGRKDPERKNPAILALCAERADLKGLPLLEGADCQAKPEAARKMTEISTTLRRTLDRQLRVTATGTAADVHRSEAMQRLLRTSRDWFQDDGLSTLAQMLQVEDVDSRCQFVKRLHAVEGAKASVLLARQALFDLNWDVRQEALQALKDRPRAEYRQVLLAALRYPWSPVAAHAAETLVAVNDQEAVFQLASLLDAPDPCAPVLDRNKKWVVPELVRVNHFRNCLLCHAASTAVSDPLRGVVPTPGQPLPRVYYASHRGDFVRADVTYLRQDFSLIQRVPKPDRWPEWQRFDYLVRMRELTAEERVVHEKKRALSRRDAYPQREAVLFALRELTGLNAGETSADWYGAFCAFAMAAPR